MFADLHNLLAQAGRCMSDKTNIVAFTAIVIPEPHTDNFVIGNLDVTRRRHVDRIDRRYSTPDLAEQHHITVVVTTSRHVTATEAAAKLRGCLNRGAGRWGGGQYRYTVKEPKP